MLGQILVTGATGFVGSNLVRELLARGHQVRVLRRHDSSPLALQGLGVEVVVGDIRDAEVVDQAVQGCAVVFHTAGLISFNERRRSYQQEVNVLGTQHVARACLKYGVSRLIHTSSINALGYPVSGLGDENLSFNYLPGKFAYCETKRMAEELLLREYQEGLPVIIVNPGTMFGPWDVYAQAGKMIVQMAKGNMFSFIEGGSSFCNVRDVVQGHLAAWGKGIPGERYILGGDNLSYQEIFAIIASQLGKKSPRWRASKRMAYLVGGVIELGASVLGKEPAFTRTMARFSGINNFFSSAKAIRQLGYQPNSCRIGIQEAIEWYREHQYI